MKKKVYKLKKPVKMLLIKSLITLCLIVADIILYHYLVVYGSYMGETAWASTFIFVGWFWLLAGQFIALGNMWEF